MDWDALLKDILGTPLTYGVGLLAVGVLFTVLNKGLRPKATAPVRAGRQAPEFVPADTPAPVSDPAPDPAPPAESDEPAPPKAGKPKPQRRERKKPARRKRQTQEEIQEEALDREAEDAAANAQALQQSADKMRAQNAQITFDYIDQMGLVTEAWMKARNWPQVLNAATELLIQGVHGLRPGLLDPVQTGTVKTLLIKHTDTFVEAAMATSHTGHVSVLEDLWPDIDLIDDDMLTSAFGRAIDRLLS